VAGILKLNKRKYFARPSADKKKTLIVCVLTGHGLKDPERALKSIKKPKAVPAKLEAILKAIKL